MTNVPQSSLAPIVLLEDDRGVVMFVRRALERAGITNPVVNFATAEEGRHYIEEFDSGVSPALFILDVGLAGAETGIDFLRWVRRQRLPLGMTAAMVLTGSEQFTDQDDAAMLGSIYFLRKPITEHELTAAVEALRLAGTGLASAAPPR